MLDHYNQSWTEMKILKLPGNEDEISSSPDYNLTAWEK